jgi:hypothetical protein
VGVLVDRVLINVPNRNGWLEVLGDNWWSNIVYIIGRDEESLFHLVKRRDLLVGQCEVRVPQ